MKKWASRLFKTGIVIAIMIVLILTVMVNMGGSSDALKSSIADYLAASTRYNARIETLHKMTFFPNISASVSEIELEHPQDERLTVTIDHATIALGFTDVIFGRRSIKELDIKNAVFAPNVIFAKPLTIQNFAIDDDPDGQAFLGLEGDIAGTNIRARVDLETKGSFGNRKYEISEESKVDITIDTLSLTGILRPRALGGFHLRDWIFAHAGTDIASGNLSFVRDGARGLDIKTTIKSVETPLNVALDGVLLANDPLQLSGEISGAHFTLNDFKTGSNFMKARVAWNEIFQTAKPLDLYIHIKAEAYDNQGQSKIHIKRENGVLEVK